MNHKGRALHWNTPMPDHAPAQHHESPSKGDNKGAIRRAKGGAMDLNLQRACGRNWALHYAAPARNGYTLVVDPGATRARPMTRAERRKPAQKWGVEGIKRWRRPNGESPLTERAAIAECLNFNVLAIRELKSTSFGTDPAGAEESLRVSKSYDHPGWFKTLFNLRSPQAKVRMYQAHHMSVALIFGRLVKGRTARAAATKRIVAKWGKTRPDATW